MEMKNKELVLEALHEKKNAMNENNMKVCEKIEELADGFANKIKAQSGASYKVVMARDYIRFLNNEEGIRLEIIIEDKLRWDRDRDMDLEARFQLKISTYSLRLNFDNKEDAEYGHEIFTVGKWFSDSENRTMIKGFVNALSEYHEENWQCTWEIEKEIKAIEREIDKEKLHAIIEEGKKYEFKSKTSVSVNSRYAPMVDAVEIVKVNPKTVKVKMIRSGEHGWEEIETLRMEYAIYMARDILKQVA